MTRHLTPAPIRIPVEYEQACAALRACASIDEAKYWSDKSDALAAWSKIYKSKEADIQAKRLKLHAYRRIGELAAELRPMIHHSVNKGGGATPGPKSLLREHGFTDTQVKSSRRLALMTQEQFYSVLNLPRPPSPSQIINQGKAAFEDPKIAEIYKHLFALRSALRAVTVEETAARLYASMNR